MAKKDLNNSDGRSSYTITIRAGADDVNMTELISYLKAIGRTQANQKIENLIMMGLLALAKKHSGKYTPEQLAMFCLENCNNLSNYSSFLRQAFGLVDPQLHSNLLQTGVLTASPQQITPPLQQQVSQLTVPQQQPPDGEINGVNVNGAVNLSPQPIADNTANLSADSQMVAETSGDPTSRSPIVNPAIPDADKELEDEEFQDDEEFETDLDRLLPE